MQPQVLVNMLCGSSARVRERGVGGKTQHPHHLVSLTAGHGGETGQGLAARQFLFRGATHLRDRGLRKGGPFVQLAPVFVQDFGDGVMTFCSGMLPARLVVLAIAHEMLAREQLVQQFIT